MLFPFNSTAKYCGSPLIPQYGYLASDSDNFYYPSLVDYVCRDNYVRRGAESLRCGEDGNWIGELPSCIGKPYPSLTPLLFPMKCQNQVVNVVKAP